MLKTIFFYVYKNYLKICSLFIINVNILQIKFIKDINLSKLIFYILNRGD